MSLLRQPLLWLALAGLALAFPAAGADATHVIGWGDSLTSGGDWLWQLDDVGHPDWTWEDHGKAAEKSWQAADGISSRQSARRFRNWLDGATPAPGDVIVFLWGTNDVRTTYWNDPARNVRHNHEATRAALSQMVDDALGAGFPVVLAVPPPVLASSNGHSEEEAALFQANMRDLLVPAVAAVVAEHPGERILAADAFGHWEALPQWPHLHYYAYSSGYADGVHPGTAPGPSGNSGRYHLAESIAAAVVEVQALSLPAMAPPSSLALVVAILGAGGHALRAGASAGRGRRRLPVRSGSVHLADHRREFPQGRRAVAAV